MSSQQRQSLTNRVLAFLSVLIALGVVTSACAEDEPGRASWNCLPEETAVAFRSPNGSAFTEALIQNTKLGSVLLSEQRVEAAKKLIMELNAEGWEEFSTTLTEYGFTLQDIPQFLAGESGFALLVTQHETEEWLLSGLYWLEPGEPLAQRAYEAIGKVIEEHEDDEQPIQRIDIDIDGRPVMQITLPIISHDYEGGFELPDNFAELSAEERQQAIEDARADMESSKTEKVRYSTVLVTTIGGRLLIANMFGGSENAVSEEDVQELSHIFARFLASHVEEEGSFATRIGAVEGVRDALSQEGTVAIELFGDVARLLLLADTDKHPMAAKVVRMLGAEDLGVFILRSTLDGSIWHTDFFLAAPEPRKGILAILDQPRLPAEPPSWVPAGVVSYSHFSLDLGKVYAVVKELVVNEFGDQAEASLQQIEMQVNAFAQADLQDVLSSLGHQHMMVNLEPRNEVPGADDESSQFSDRGAVVWQLKDEQIWSRLLQAVAPFVASMIQDAEFTEEQGFRGWRFTVSTFEGGLFLGKGFLVLAFGEGVLETILSALNNPLKGEDALLGNEVYRKARSMMELQPGIGFEVLDGNRYAKTARRTLEALLDQWTDVQHMIESGEPSDRGAWASKIKELLPNEDEVENILGVTVGQTLVNEDGLSSKTSYELPPAN